ncbi:MAG TPA: hypothetical protein VFR97_03125 [Capillimicrobium sp.]|nr:hypothetical protein [Capillimicrobium sp.]
MVDALVVLISLIVFLMLAVPLVLLVADLARGRDGRGDVAPPAPSYGDQIARRSA